MGSVLTLYRDDGAIRLIMMGLRLNGLRIVGSRAMALRHGTGGFASLCYRFSSSTADSSEDQVLNKVVVVGGNGFVGSAVCRAAVQFGAQEVVSVSRSGAPKADQLAKSDWAQRVTWLKGDALEARVARGILSGSERRYLMRGKLRKP